LPTWLLYLYIFLRVKIATPRHGLSGVHILTLWKQRAAAAGGQRTEPEALPGHLGLNSGDHGISVHSAQKREEKVP
jgi:hypothetical protein